jgi:hypothetical protein
MCHSLISTHKQAAAYIVEHEFATNDLEKLSQSSGFFMSTQKSPAAQRQTGLICVA